MQSRRLINDPRMFLLEVKYPFEPIITNNDYMCTQPTLTGHIVIIIISSSISILVLCYGKLNIAGVIKAYVC